MPDIDGAGGVSLDDLMAIRIPVDLDVAPGDKLLSIVVQRRRDQVVPRLGFLNLPAA
jgi:hypothetical protein